MYTKFQIINDHSVILQERTSFILFSSSLAFLIFFALSSSAFSFSTSSLFKQRNQKFQRTFYQTFSTWVSTAIFPRLRQFLICQIVPLSRGIRWWSHSSQVPRSSRCYPHLRKIKFENIFFVWRTKTISFTYGFVDNYGRLLNSYVVLFTLRAKISRNCRRVWDRTFGDFDIRILFDFDTLGHFEFLLRSKVLF